jgi:hypothetical protein
MRFGELKDAVNALGGQSVSLTDQYENIEQSGDARFCSIVTRAMSEINLLRPRVSDAVIHMRAPETSFCFSKPVSVNGYIEIPITGAKAYTLEYKGVGTIKIGGSSPESIDSPYAFKRIVGILDGSMAVGVIRIESSFMLTVRNVAVYTETISNRIDDVPPYSERIEYTVEEDDFVALSPDSVLLEDVKAYGVKIRDNRYISVPWTTRADISIRYDRKIRGVTVDTKDSDELDLDEDLARGLLPSLVASYAFYDPSDSIMSVYFRQIYESDRSVLVSKLHNADASRVYSTNNW